MSLGRRLLIMILGLAFVSLPGVVYAEGLNDSAVSTPQIENKLMTHDVLLTNKPALVSLRELKSKTDYIICLDKQADCLGTYTSDVNGQLFVQITLPNTVANGEHRLYVRETISQYEIYKTVVVNGDELQAKTWPKAE